MLIEKIDSAHTITDLPELESDTCELGRDTKKDHETDTQRSCSPRRKTPEIRRNNTDEKKKNKHI